MSDNYYRAAFMEIMKAAETGGAALKSAIRIHGGLTDVDLYTQEISNVVSAAVNWRHSHHIRDRNSFTESERDLVYAVDAMLRLAESTENDYS